ncbi:hypothetical protein ShzoTeo12_53450 (plasmid) [Shinella zoogloeoides]|nr:hypothetical protein ShzoTeo12_53450 [Shinella zoogloeoides]
MHSDIALASLGVANAGFEYLSDPIYRDVQPRLNDLAGALFNEHGRLDIDLTKLDLIAFSSIRNQCDPPLL